MSTNFDSMLNWNELLDPNKSWSQMYTGTERSVDNFAFYADRPAEIVSRIIRGKRCASALDLFREWAAALQFPYYFGENWDAFDECICDLEWLPGVAYIFFITRADCLLSCAESDLTILLSMLESAAAYWGASEDSFALGPHAATPFRVVFQSEDASAEIFRHLSGGSTGDNK